jgi:hypothetical protein
VLIHGTSASERLWMSFGRAFLQGAAYSVEAGSAEEITVDGKGRYDIVERLEGSPGDDWVVLRPGETVIRGADFTNTAIGFEEVYAYGSAGKDTASLYDTAADDTFKSNGQSDWAWMRGPGYFHRAKGFDFVHGYSTGGADQAYLHDSAGDDQFKAYTDDAKDMEYAKLFDTVLARSSRGEDDLALFFDDPGTTNGQVFRGLAGKGELFGKTAGGSDFQVTARNFAAVTATESRGTGHVARLVDTPGDDHLVIDGALASMYRYNRPARRLRQGRARPGTSLPGHGQRSDRGLPPTESGKLRGHQARQGGRHRLALRRPDWLARHLDLDPQANTRNRFRQNNTPTGFQRPPVQARTTALPAPAAAATRALAKEILSIRLNLDCS